MLQKYIANQGVRFHGLVPRVPGCRGHGATTRVAASTAADGGGGGGVDRGRMVDAFRLQNNHNGGIIVHGGHEEDIVVFVAADTTTPVCGLSGAMTVSVVFGCAVLVVSVVTSPNGSFSGSSFMQKFTKLIIVYWLSAMVNSG